MAKPAGVRELEQKETERALEEAQILARLGSWQYDVATNQIKRSANLLRIMGLPPEMATGDPTSVLDLVHPDDADGLITAARRTCETGEPFDHTYRLSAPAGELYMRCIGRPLYDDAGKLTQLVGSIQDVTDAKLTELALKQSEAFLSQQRSFLRSVIDTDPNYIFVKDQDGVYILANKAVADHYGTTVEELVGKRDADFNRHAEEVRGFTDMDRRVIQTGLEEFSCEERLQSSEGERYLQTVKRPIQSLETGETQVLGICVDITDRVRSQRQFEAAREAALESSRLKSEFLANMSHEIRTPMNGVIGMADLLLDSKMDSEQQELARTIRDSADSLLTILNDILDFSKIEAGKMSTESLPVDIADLLERVAVSFALRAEAKHLGFAIDIDWRHKWTYSTDPVRLRQVLSNLIGNAVKFTDEGKIHVSLRLSSSGIPQIEISDTGVGIPNDRLDAIFGAFTQGDGSTTRKHGGTGLGLAIAHQLATLLGGVISVISEPGQGSRFILDLNVERVITSFSDERRLLGKRVAIVMDDSEIGSFSRGALLSLGAAVVAAEGDHDAILFDARNGEAPPVGRAIALLQRGSLLPQGAVDAIYEPLTRRALIDAVGRAAGSRPASEGRPVRSGRKLRVLLVEDNSVNQRVAQRQLEKEGLSVEIAESGVEAIAYTSKADYDLVFMDVQMPEMDGLEATRRIRARDDALGRHIPIIAMTAHAMKGDRERCLDVGVDDYLSKPLRREDLREKISVWVETEESMNIEELDEDYLQSAFGDDEEFLAEVLHTYVTSSMMLADELKDALSRDDQARIRSIAHALKGSSRSVGAVAFADRCEALERSETPEATTESAQHALHEIPRLLAGCRTRVRTLQAGLSAAV